MREIPGYRSITVHPDNWVSLHHMWPEGNPQVRYTFSHEGSCHGHKVACLPYRWHKGNLEFLLVHESTPCWEGATLVPSSLTGGWTGGPFQETVLAELREEAGFTPDWTDLFDLGTCYGTKSTDTVYHLFTVNLTGQEPDLSITEVDEDGGNQDRHAEWTKMEDIFASPDPLVHVMFTRTAVALAWKGQFGFVPLPDVAALETSSGNAKG